ncbi:MAG: Cof-type HAD-IIB family hydrolase [Clostridiales Family XIII bacterium]|jgi:Cof subfamily protein (haloacid dehalogenase superfamily)|nr:Cof-type HAD-IIB family hydrolase [Clostridiales Family XIII bacterium]
MNDLRGVFADLDGSLLNKEHRIGETDLATIKTLKRRGIPVFLATGRHILFAEDAAAAVGFDLPVCACNGGHIYDFHARETLFVRAIAQPVAAKTFAFLRESKLDYTVYTPQRVIFRTREVFRRYRERVNVPLAPGNRFTPHFAEDGFDPDAEDILKFLIRCDAPQALAREIAALLGAEDAGRICVSRSDAAFLDINAAGVNKGEAARLLSERFGFRLEDAMALGDSDNDAALLRAVGTAVAPRNAEAAIRALAAFITTDCTDSPLTNAVSRFFPALL